MEKKLYDLVVNEKFQRLCPPLREAERQVLEESIITNGCEVPLIVWKGTDTIVDGHNRYRICREHGIPFEYAEKEFEDENDAVYWIVMNQLGRRNLSTFSKCELVVPLELILQQENEKRGRERRLETWRAKKETSEEGSVFNRTPNPGTKSRDIVAEFADVSATTYLRAKKIITQGDEETKDKLRKGELTVFSAYNAMKSREKKTADDAGQDEPLLPESQPQPVHAPRGGTLSPLLEKPIITDPLQQPRIEGSIVFNPVAEDADGNPADGPEYGADDLDSDDLTAEDQVREMVDDFLEELSQVLETAGRAEAERILEVIRDMADSAVSTVTDKMNEMEE